MLVSASEKNADRRSRTISAPNCADKGMSSIYEDGAVLGAER
jgi:hypothetical protein